MNTSAPTGRFIRTHKGNLLCCVEIGGKNFFFAMTKDGLRFPFKHELVRKDYLNEKEWDHALATWNKKDGSPVEVETLEGRDLKNAIELAELVAKDFTFGMSPEQINGLGKNFRKRF